MSEYGDLGGFGYDGDFGLADFEADLESLNDSLAGLSGFDALAGAGRIVLPVVLGSGVTFGTAAAIEHFVHSENARKKWVPYKWLIGTGAGLVAGLATYKFAGPTEGVLAMAGSVLTGLTGWGMSKITGSASTSGYIIDEPHRGYGRYELREPQPIFGRYRLEQPQQLFERYTMQQPQPVYEGLQGQILTTQQTPTEALGGVNPGIFG